MGRIVFNADVFSPSQFRAPRREPESRSNIGDQWLTPQGVLTAATLAKMAGGLKLPAGFRDEGVDANAEALKVAAQARQAAKSKIEKTESTARSERMRTTTREGDTEADRKRVEQNLADDEAARTSVDIKPGMMADMRDETIVRARARAVELEKQGKMQEAMDVLEQAGDRIGQTSMRLTPEERGQRRRQVASVEQARQRRMGATGDEVGAFNEAIRLAKEKSRLPASVAVKRGDTLGGIAKSLGFSLRDVLEANPEIKDPNRISVGQVIQVPGDQVGPDEKQPAGDAFKAAGLGININDLKGEGSEKVRNMSREQLRDILVRWKQGDKEAVMSEISNLQGDQQEVAAFEEMLLRQMNRRRSQEAGVRGVDRLMTEAEEAKISEESAEKFLADKRRDDPYYGMRPEDAVRQIMEDAPLAKTEQEQRKLRSLMQKYTPKRQTFADLFFDNTNERSMANTANLNKLLPDPEKELTEFERAKQALELAELTDREDIRKRLGPEGSKYMLELRLLKARIDKEEAQARKVKSAIGSRNKGGAIKALKVHRDSFNKDVDAKFKIDALKTKADALLKKSKSTEAKGVRQRLASGLSLTDAQEMSRNTALSPEAQKALDELAGALEARDRYVAEAGDALTRAQAAAVAGNLDLSGREFRRYTKLTDGAHIDLLNRTEEITNKIVDTLKAAVFGGSR